MVSTKVVSTEVPRRGVERTGDGPHHLHCPVSCLRYICLTSEQDHFLFLIVTYLNHYTRSIQIMLFYLINTKLFSAGSSRDLGSQRSRGKQRGEEVSEEERHQSNPGTVGGGPFVSS